VVEVAHEAILRQWTALKIWLAEERDSLRTLEALRVAASEWRARGLPMAQTAVAASEAERASSWLTHRGNRLREAEALVGRTDFARAFGPSELAYLAACRKVENDDLENERAQLRRTRRLQSRVGALIVLAAVVVLVAGLGVMRLISGLGLRTSNTLAE